MSTDFTNETISIFMTCIVATRREGRMISWHLLFMSAMTALGCLYQSVRSVELKLLFVT